MQSQTAGGRREWVARRGAARRPAAGRYSSETQSTEWNQSHIEVTRFMPCLRVGPQSLYERDDAALSLFIDLCIYAECEQN